MEKGKNWEVWQEKKRLLELLLRELKRREKNEIFTHFLKIHPSYHICCQYQLFALIQKVGCINGKARESDDKSVDLEETRLTSYP